MNILDFFKKVGSVLRGALHVIEKVVPEGQLIAAIGYVREAAHKFADNASRREWVVAQIVARFHIPESVARFITELALQQIKNGVDKGIDKVEDDVTDPA